MKKQGYLQISFAWLFAIIVGAIILFLAIYFAYKFVGTSQQVTNAQVGKEVQTISNSLESGFDTSKSVPFKMQTDTRINNLCSSSGTFGSQGIQISQQNFGKWQDVGAPITMENRYIFSQSQVQGRDFYMFSKTFSMPFQVSDVIFMTSLDTTYCFINAPLDIQSELTNLNQPNLLISNCPANSVKVCFDSNGCTINVNTASNSVEKNGTTLYYQTDALMYGAIFSDPLVYECQVQRLMGRIKELSRVYAEKDPFITNMGCQNSADINRFLISVNNVKSSQDLASLKQAADQLDSENSADPECMLW